MKKFITLVLVLVLALGLTVPAMAFTSDSEAADDSIPYSLKVYLVEYEDNDLFGFATLPESDRGYAKNEIVAAVVELDIPDGEDIHDNYTWLKISGDNVSFNVTDAPLMSKDTEKAGLGLDDVVKDGKIDSWEVKTTAMKDDVTYKWLVFAKVTDDDASITAKLVDGLGSNDFNGNSPSSVLALTLEGVDYTVTHTGNTYTILVGAQSEDYHDALITIDVDDDDVSEGMSITPSGGEIAALGVNVKGELGVIDPDNASKFLSSDDAADYLDIYNDVVVDVFGLDYFKIGNYVRESYFEDLTSSDTLVATVDIAPWTAYVTVPDNIVVDPPKTGDAASIMGLVMVALSGAGVVALRKRG